MIEMLESRRLYSAAAVNCDVNRDAVVNGDDFFVVDANQGQAVTGWANGDINGDGMCDGADAALLTAAWEAANAGSGTIVTDSGFQALVLKPGDANGDGEVTDADFYDLNQDGTVDDYERWEASQGEPDRTGTWSTGDFNGDGLVNHTDSVIFNAVIDRGEYDEIIDGDEWFEIDSCMAQDAVSAFYG